MVGFLTEATSGSAVKVNKYLFDGEVCLQAVGVEKSAGEGVTSVTQ